MVFCSFSPIYIDDLRFENFMILVETLPGYRNQVGIGLSYRPARLHRLAEYLHSLESIPGLYKRLKIWAQEAWQFFFISF
jgi:hypothetical protein